MTKYVVLGEKAKAQLIRDSKKDIELSIAEVQKNPLNYTQVSLFCFLPLGKVFFFFVCLFVFPCVLVISVAYLVVTIIWKAPCYLQRK